jgi:hypothetical protein
MSQHLEKRISKPKAQERIPELTPQEHSELADGSYKVLDRFEDDLEQVSSNEAEGPYVLANYIPTTLSNDWFRNNFDNDITRLFSTQKRALISTPAQPEQSDETEEGCYVPDLVPNLCPQSLPERIAKSINHKCISDNLFKIYHDSMENALSCWLNERTCPYRYQRQAIASSENLIEAWGYDWPNRIFQRVRALDRVSGKFIHRPMSKRESAAASKALYLVIMAFSSQWAQASQRNNEQHYSIFGGVPPSNHSAGNALDRLGNGNEEFDRVLQQEYWNEARKALLDCADVESFLVAFANIIFSLTQRPISKEEKQKIRSVSISVSSLEYMDADLDDLHHRVYRVIGEDGPPIHLEQGVRHVHSLRHKLHRKEREMAIVDPTIDPKHTILTEEDRETVDLMAWLGYMLESLTSAMHERPLVVSDEDCDVLPESIAALSLDDEEAQSPNPVSEKHGSSRLWNDYFFLQERHNRRGMTLRLPCSYEEQAAGLADAAPIKVLLYRKVTQLQSMFSRYASAQKIEDGIQDALKVYEHWIIHYEPFIKDCIGSHNLLNPRIQSWYVSLTGHFYLAALLLADIIRSIDAGSNSLPSHRALRESIKVAFHLRQHSSRIVSDLARCATPCADASLSQSNFHFALNAGALLTIPWTALFIRVFSQAAVHFLTESSTISILTGPDAQTCSVELVRRAEDCIRALKYLGRKSDTARLAGDTLDDALQKQSIVQRLRASVPFTHGSSGGLFSGDDSFGGLNATYVDMTSWEEWVPGVTTVGNEAWLGLGDDLADELNWPPG